MTGCKILVVEDEKKINELLKEYLVKAGYMVSVLDHGDRVIPEVKSNSPDLIILDIMLPGKDGIAICQEIRSFSKVPILMLTARVDEIDRLLGLELGADDYVCKPFSPREVVARVKAILRRFGHNEYMPDEKVIAGPVTIDPVNYNATIEGKRLRLTPNEFEILKLMASQPAEVFKRSDLISNIHGYESKDSERTIDSHIKNLRKKIDEVLPGNTLIRTVYGMGYSLSFSHYDNQQEGKPITC